MSRLSLVIGAAVFLVLVLVSTPWLILAGSYIVLGDDATADRLVARCPLARWLDWRTR